MKNRDGKSPRKKKKEDQGREGQKKEGPGARRNRKVAKHCVFSMICGSRSSRGRLAKQQAQGNLAR